jgi:hypothetical protein
MAAKEPGAAPEIGAVSRLRTRAKSLQHDIAKGRDSAAAHMKAKQDRRIAAIEASANAFAKAPQDFIEGTPAGRCAGGRN